MMGGVGPITIAMSMVDTVIITHRAAGKCRPNFDGNSRRTGLAISLKANIVRK